MSDTVTLSPEPQAQGHTPTAQPSDPLPLAPSSSASETGFGIDPQTDLWPRCLGRVVGKDPENAPVLLVTGGMHGNEPAGVLALRRIFRSLEADPTGLVGELVGFTGNRKALQRGVRFLQHDLNRCWTPERLEVVRNSTDSLEAEDDEMRALEREIRGVRERAPRGGAFALDLHTTSGPGPAFVILDDTLPNREYAMDLPVPLVVGIEEELAGTVTHHLHDEGFRVFGFEAGQHEDETSVDRAAAAVWMAMEISGVLEKDRRPEVAAARDLLTRTTGGLPHVVEVRYRHPVAPTDDFRMRVDRGDGQKFKNFDVVEAGQILAHDKRGPIHSPENGLMLMPLYQQQGEDGFFVVRPLRPAWLKLSARLRRMNAEWVLPWLP
ncbi:MAG: succinylglutamate desuccinylase/aspartoacylase family protein, partial [Thermoanaerobaculia bacterium]|nr:succinylglutamate desuccinylase/aspartoacylase family protein [Thermoanaerobaculia bacterium]